MQRLLGEGRGVSDLNPALLGRSISGVSLGSAVSDLDARAVDLLLGNHVDDEHVKVSLIFWLSQKIN